MLELRQLLRSSPIRLLTLDRFPDIPPVKENGSTFRANAIKKAIEISRHTILPVFAEDSGLQVRILGGRPGVRSARFAGLRQDSDANITKLLRLMRKVPPSKRQARFVCCLALAIGGCVVRTFQASCAGSIALEKMGRAGFGYDPIFIPHGFHKTMAQLGPPVKNKISHRSKAVTKFQKAIRTDL